MSLVIVVVIPLQIPQGEAKMKEACEAMMSLYPKHSYPLEVLCSHHLKTGNCSSNPALSRDNTHDSM